MDRVFAEWKRFSEGLPLEGCLRSVILESWQQRSAGVKPTTDRILLRRLADADFQGRLNENSEWLTLARPHLDKVSAWLAQVPHVFCLIDRDGIVLYATGDRSQLDKFGFVPGSDWSERAVGTNGAGTALAANLPVAVVGPEHFIHGLHDRTCTGAPLHAPNGQVIAAINLNTSRTNGHPERLAWVAHLGHVLTKSLPGGRRRLVSGTWSRPFTKARTPPCHLGTYCRLHLRLPGRSRRHPGPGIGQRRLRHRPWLHARRSERTRGLGGRRPSR